MQQRRGTVSELLLQRAIHARGLRYRVGRSAPSCPRRSIGIAFPLARPAGSLDGWIWHGCPFRVSWRKSNSDLWVGKIRSNRERDADTDQRLLNNGWHFMGAWENEVPDALDDVMRSVSSAVWGAV